MATAAICEPGALTRSDVLVILTVAVGLSYQQAAGVCGCQIAAIESWVSQAWREISRASQDDSLRTKEKTRRAAVGNLVGTPSIGLTAAAPLGFAGTNGSVTECADPVLGEACSSASLL